MTAKRIIVTDDEEPVLEAVYDELRLAGYETTKTRSGEELLSAYRTQAFDLVLCDLFMPGKDGLQVIRELLKDFPKAKIVAMSAGGFDGTLNLLHTAQLLGAKDILPKPFKREKLLQIVERVLAG
jgi:CheY-like chemotaxis protein